MSERAVQKDLFAVKLLLTGLSHVKCKRSLLMMKTSKMRSLMSLLLGLAQIKGELMLIAWHQLRRWDWCMPADEKKGVKYGFCAT